MQHKKTPNQAGADAAGGGLFRDERKEQYRQLGEEIGIFLQKLQDDMGWNNERMVMLLLAICYGRARGTAGWTLPQLLDTAGKLWAGEETHVREGIPRSGN